MGLVLACALALTEPAPAAPVDLNTATVEQLTALPGVGPKRAQAIVADRARRPYTRVTQLLEVRGIGKRTLERLRPLITVAPAKATPAAQVPEAPSTTKERQ